MLALGIVLNICNILCFGGDWWMVLQVFPEECLYVMYNQDLFDSNESSDDDESPVTEIRFIPDNFDHGKCFQTLRLAPRFCSRKVCCYY